MPPSSESVKVGVRIRPLNSNELGSECCIRVDTAGTSIAISAPPAVAGAAARRANNPTTAPLAHSGSHAAAVASTFAFDHIFWSAGDAGGYAVDPPPDASQADVYDAIGAPIVRHATEGFNSCLFAYGQTGSGKTHTMLGEVGDSELMGIVPRLCRDLFDSLGEMQRQQLEAQGAPTSRWTVELGFVEIYNETLIDLFSKVAAANAAAKQRAAASARGSTSARGPSSKVSSPLLSQSGGGDKAAAVIRESSDRGVFIENQTLRPISSADEALAAIEEASAVRTVASTRMNQRSSRSHAVIQLHLVEIAVKAAPSASPQRAGAAAAGSRGGGILRRSVVNMVDLAGSERVKSTGAAGDQLEQAKYINMSLTTLGRVIDALANLSKKAAPGATARTANLDSRPPYRESKLTFMLKSSLGGNSRTRMIAAVSPSAVQADESLSTLRYASRARDIVNTVHVNEDPLRRRIRELEAEMNALRTELTSAAAQGGGGLGGAMPPEYVRSLEERIELLQADADMKVEQLATAAIEHERTVLDQLYNLAQTDEERERLAHTKAALEAELDEAHAVLDAYMADLDRMRAVQSEREQRHLEELRARDVALEKLQKDLAATQSRSTVHLERTIAMLSREKLSKESTIQRLTEELSRLTATLLTNAASADVDAEEAVRRSVAHTELTDQVTILHDERSRIAAALESATSASTDFRAAQQSQGQLIHRSDIMTLLERESLSRQWLHSAANEELAQLYRAFATAGLTIQERCNAAVNAFLERQNDELREDLQLVVDRLHETRSHAERYALRCETLEEALGEAQRRQGALEELVEAAAAAPTPGASPATSSRVPAGSTTTRPRGTSSASSSVRPPLSESPRMPLSARPPLSARTDTSSSAGGGAGSGEAPSQVLRRLRDLESQLASAHASLELSRDENLKFRVALMTAEVEGFEVPTELLHPDYGADDGTGGFAACSLGAARTGFRPSSEANQSFSEDPASGSATGRAEHHSHHDANDEVGALEGGDMSFDASVMRLTAAPLLRHGRS